jgi:hypothetical protein
MISGIGADRERDAEPRALRDFLQLVVLCRERRCGSAEPGDEAVDVDVADKFGRGREIVLRADAGAPQRSGRACSAVHHQAGFLLERHPGDEILCAARRSEAPVFVRIDDAVPVEIPEAEPSLCDDPR